MANYDVLDVLGEGQFSVVKRCRNPPANTSNGAIPDLLRQEASRQYAIKQIAKDRIRSIDEVLRVEHELHALKLCSPHPNVIKFYEAMHGRDSIYIVTEILPLDLVSHPSLPAPLFTLPFKILMIL